MRLKIHTKEHFNKEEVRESENISTLSYDDRGYLKLLEAKYTSRGINRNDYNRYEYENEYDIKNGIIKKSRCNHFLYEDDKEPHHINDLEFEYFDKEVW